MIETPKISGRPVKILVVDDEEIVLSFARDALEDVGYQIELASGGLEALKMIEKEHFDFILTDIRMPECDGIELARRATEMTPSVGIIFMTGYANLNSAKDAIKEGAYDYIMKPFELQELRQAVKNAVRKRQKDTEKTLSSELNRLSDLNQLMYTVSDRRSLMRLSLGFAMMLGKACRGSVIFKNDNDREIGVISTDNLPENSFEESFKKYKTDYFELDSQLYNAPFLINSIDEHPLYQKYREQELLSLLTAPWYREHHRLVNIALKRGPKLYGFIILGYPEDTEPLKESAHKLLSITASQIAISLENITLLEGSRNAYRRLKELQDQTIQLEKMAAKGQMSAEIGHELNNFLGIVMGNLSLMQFHLGKKDYDELGKYLDAVVSNLESIKNFTDGLMDFSTIETSFKECDINDLISDVIEYLQASQHFKDIKIVFEKSDSKIYTQADIRQIQQLLYNLLNNAAEATLENDKTEIKQITIITGLNKENNEFSITILDNGKGIDPQFLDKAFKERFTTKESGHGFGLQVCQRIVENHQGKLDLKSSKEGTAITINFPIKSLSPELEPVS